MLDDGPPGDPDGFSDRRPGDAAPAFPDDVIPIHSIGDQLKDITHEDARSPKCEFAMADFRVDTNESSDRFLFHGRAFSKVSGIEFT